MLKIADTMENQLRAIDCARSVFENPNTGVWLVASKECPSPTTGPEDIQSRKDEVHALLHYARIGIMAAHGKI